MLEKRLQRIVTVKEMQFYFMPERGTNDDVCGQSGDALWVCVLPFQFAVVIDVVTELARQSILSQLLYDDDLVLMSEAIEGLMYKFINL